MASAMVYVGPRRATLVGGDAHALGYGFNLGGLIRAGIGLLTGIRPPAPTAVGPTAPLAIAPTAGSIVRDIGKVLAAPSPIPNPFFGLFGPAGAPAAGKRRRRMNPLNLRALGRADRRLTSFEKIARRYVRRDAPQRRVRAFKKRR